MPRPRALPSLNSPSPRGIIDYASEGTMRYSEERVPKLLFADNSTTGKQGGFFEQRKSPYSVNPRLRVFAGPVISDVERNHEH